VILPRVNEAEGNLKKRREGPYGGVGVLPYRGEEGVCFFFFFFLLHEKESTFVDVQRCFFII
jgi:hypothetical protein